MKSLVKIMAAAGCVWLVCAFGGQDRDWREFTSREGWSVQYPASRKIASCRSCLDAHAPGVFVSFLPPGNKDGSVVIEPLAPKPKNTDADAWLAQVAMSANQNPHLKEQKLQVAGGPALRVQYQAPASEMEEVFVLSGDKTFSISFDADATHGPLESLPNYFVFNAMVDSFRPSAGLVVAPALPQQPSLQKGDLVWTWSKRCNGDQKLGVSVRLDGKVLYRGVLPICRGSRDAEDGRATFHFNGGHSFQGEYHTRSADSIEGDIWQAGGEPDALTLGISFDSGKQVLLNTVHIAKPEKQVSSALDKGLFITTYPVNGR